MAQKQNPLPAAQVPWVDRDGRPNQSFAVALAAIARGIIGPLTSAVDDAAAAAAGVPINGLYQNAGAVRVRLT